MSKCRQDTDPNHLSNELFLQSHESWLVAEQSHSMCAFTSMQSLPKAPTGLYKNQAAFRKTQWDPANLPAVSEEMVCLCHCSHQSFPVAVQISKSSSVH